MKKLNQNESEREFYVEDFINLKYVLYIRYFKDYMKN